MPYSPVCLPPKEILSNMFVGDTVQMSGYGYTSNDKGNRTACKFQGAKLKIISAEDKRCKKVFNYLTKICRKL